MTTRRRNPLLTVVMTVVLGLGAGAMVIQSVSAFGIFEAFIARTAIRSIGVKIQERNDRAQVNRQRDRRLAAVAAREAALEVRLGLSAEAAERERARFAQMREAIKQTALRERQIISYNARRRIRANLRNTVRDAIKAAVAVDPRAIDALIGMFEGKKPLKAMLEAALSEQPADPRQTFRDLRDRLRDVQRAASAIGGARAIDIKARIRQALLEASGLADGDGPVPDDMIQRFRELLDARRGARDALATFVGDLVPDGPGIDEERFGHDPRWREQMATIRALNAPEAKARLVSSLLSRSIDRIGAIAGEAGIALTDEQFERIAREVLSAWVKERYEDGRLVRGKVVDIDQLVRHAINESLGARGLDLLPEPSEPDPFSGSGFAEFVGEALQLDRAIGTDSKLCEGNVPIRAYVSWTPDTSRVEINYHRVNVVGLPRDFGSGDTNQYLECLQGGRQVTHQGGFDPMTGVLDALDEGRRAPELVDVVVEWDLDDGVVSSVSGSLTASDVFNRWDVTFALTAPCSGGGSLADFTAANTHEDADGRASYAPPDQPKSGVIVTGCTLDLVSPPGGPLELSLADLPAWAQEQLLTVGAVGWACSDPLLQVIDGDPLVLIDGQRVARLGDPIDGDGTITTGSSTILVNGQPAALAASC